MQRQQLFTIFIFITVRRSKFMAWKFPNYFWPWDTIWFALLSFNFTTCHISVVSKIKLQGRGMFFYTRIVNRINYQRIIFKWVYKCRNVDWASYTSPHKQLVNVQSVPGVAMNLELNEQVEKEDESQSKMDLTAYQAISLIANPFRLAT